MKWFRKKREEPPAIPPYVPPVIEHEHAPKEPEIEVEESDASQSLIQRMPKLIKDYWNR